MYPTVLSVLFFAAREADFATVTVPLSPLSETLIFFTRYRTVAKMGDSPFPDLSPPEKHAEQNPIIF